MEDKFGRTLIVGALVVTQYYGDFKLAEVVRINRKRILVHYLELKEKGSDIILPTFERQRPGWSHEVVPKYPNDVFMVHSFKINLI